MTSQGPGQASGCLAGRCPPLAGCWAGSGKISSRQKKLKLQLNIIIEAEAACAHNLLFMQQLLGVTALNIFLSFTMMRKYQHIKIQPDPITCGRVFCLTII